MLPPEKGTSLDNREKKHTQIEHEEMLGKVGFFSGDYVGQYLLL